MTDWSAAGRKAAATRRRRAAAPKAVTTRKRRGEALPTDPLNSYMTWRDLSPDAKEYLLLLATLHSADHHIWFYGRHGSASCAFCETPMPPQ